MLQHAQCPWCSGRMEPFELEGIEIDFCSKCLRTWFDHDELRRYLNEDDFEFDFSKARFVADVDPQKALTCPKCTGLSLLEKLQPDVGAYGCRSCKGVLMSRVAFCFLRAHLRVQRREAR